MEQLSLVDRMPLAQALEWAGHIPRVMVNSTCKSLQKQPDLFTVADVWWQKKTSHIAYFEPVELDKLGEVSLRQAGKLSSY